MAFNDLDIVSLSINLICNNRSTYKNCFHNETVSSIAKVEQITVFNVLYCCDFWRLTLRMKMTSKKRKKDKVVSIKCTFYITHVSA